MVWKRLVVVMLLLILSALTATGLGNISCSIKASCSGDEIPVLSMTDPTNSHGMLPSQTGNNYVCCNGPQGFTTSNGGPTIINVSLTGHLEKTSEGNYADGINVSSIVNIDCTYRTLGVAETECQERYACMFGISGDTNAHAGACSDYADKVCCRCTQETELLSECSDGIDNDCDGDIDCADYDCRAWVNGTVYATDDTGEFPVFEADVELYQLASLLDTDSTDSNGWYGFETQCGEKDIVARKDNFAPSTIHTNLSPGGTHFVNFTGNASLVPADGCEADCTLNTGDHLKFGCHLVNGCAFYDVQHAIVCNEALFLNDPSFTPWVRSYDATQDIECRAGAIPFVRSEEQANVQCPEGTKSQVVTKSIATVGGKAVNVNVVVCVP